MPQPSPCQALVFCSLCFVASFSAAQVAPSFDTSSPQTVTITGTATTADYRAIDSTRLTKTDTPLKEIPASISVIPAQLMKDQAMLSLADVIRYVPGASVHQGEGNRDEFVLRGIVSSANLYVDGVRDDAQVFRDLYNLERVEVLKGAGGMIFGRGAGGVINRVTKQPAFAPLASGSLTLGSHDQVRATLDFGDAAGASLAWRLNAMAEQAHGFRDGTSLQRHAINPSATWQANSNTTLTVGFEHLRDRRTADRGFPSFNAEPFEAPPSRFFGSAEQSTAHSRVDGAYAVFESDLGPAQLRNSFRVTHYDKFYQNVFPATTTAVSAAGLVTLNAYNNSNRRTNVFNQTDLTGKASVAGFEHSWLLGLEWGQQRSRNLRNTGFFGAAAAATSINVPVSNPVATATAFRANGTDANNHVRAALSALLAQDQLALSPTWKLLAGVRFDEFKAALADHRTTLNATTTPSTATDLSRTDRALSPRLGLIWLPQASASYYASYSYSFLPSAETLGLTVLDRNSGLSTADFKPENAKNYEVGARWDLLSHLTLSAAVFRLDRNHVRNADGNGGFVQSGQQRTQGAELGLQGNLTPIWQVYAGAALLSAQIRQATAAAGVLGHTVALVPARSLSVWNRVDLGAGWAAGLGLVHQSATFANVDNLVTLPAFSKLDGALFYTFATGKTRLALNAANLLNTRYFSTADANNNLTPGAPRSASLTLQTKL
jgi:catecholate siderophore receptor